MNPRSDKNGMIAVAFYFFPALFVSRAFVIKAPKRGSL